MRSAVDNLTIKRFRIAISLTTVMQSLSSRLLIGVEVR